MKRFALYTILFLSAFNVCAQDLSLYRYGQYDSAGNVLPYRLLKPAGAPGQRQYPLLVFLHGAFEKGADNTQQLAIGGKFFLRDSIRSHYPAFVLFPQCPENDAWAYFENRLDLATGTYTDWVFPFRKKPTLITGMLLQLVNHLVVNDSIDRARIYIAGVSQGGMGVLDVIARRPDIFSGALAVCGAGEPSTARLFAGQTGLWLFHGDKDNVVPIEFARQFYKKLSRAHSVVRYSEYRNVEHNSWVNAFAEPDLMKWLFAQRKKE